MAEIQVGVRELKSRLSHYLRQVKAGHPVTITERGQPVGRILPVANRLVVNPGGNTLWWT